MSSNWGKFFVLFVFLIENCSVRHLNKYKPSRKGPFVHFLQAVYEFTSIFRTFKSKFGPFFNVVSRIFFGCQFAPRIAILSNY